MATHGREGPEGNHMIHVTTPSRLANNWLLCIAIDAYRTARKELPEQRFKSRF